MTVPFAEATAAFATERRFVRTQEAASITGIASATLCKYRSVGGGPRFTKIGSAVVYEVADLYEWLDAQGKRSSTAAM